MSFFKQYQLFLLDFDGLLVNTEELHYRAYKQMCKERGFELSWSFNRYCHAAHVGATEVRDQLYAEYPKLAEQEPEWDVLYAEKKRIYIQIIKKGNVSLLPGVESFLTNLQKANLKRCVVTHSGKELVDIIRSHLPILNTIPHWFTREDYDRPKPHPDGYLKAIEQLAHPNDKIVGFEDTPRGIQALRGTRATPILIAPSDYCELQAQVVKGIQRFDNFSKLP